MSNVLSNNEIAQGLLTAVVMAEIEEARDNALKGIKPDLVELVTGFFNTAVSNTLTAVEKHLTLTGTVDIPEEDSVVVPVSGLADAYCALVNN